VFRYLQGEPSDCRRKITTHKRTRTLGYEVQHNGQLRTRTRKRLRMRIRTTMRLTLSLSGTIVDCIICRCFSQFKHFKNKISELLALFRVMFWVPFVGSTIQVKVRLMRSTAAATAIQFSWVHKYSSREKFKSWGSNCYLKGGNPV